MGCLARIHFSHIAALGLAIAELAVASSDLQDVSVNSARLLTPRADTSKDPTNFGWIQNWAAIGDSFTAGIGSGHQIGNSITLDEDWRCSKYDYSWVKIVDFALGSSVQNFQFKACSGDRTGQIYDQIDGLRDGLDLVMMTAGGNDLCLGAMIKTCVIMPWEGEGACQAIIDKARENINTILKPNIQQVLQKLNSKIKKDGALIYSGYAPFFSLENEDCADSNKQNWSLKGWGWLEFWNIFKTPLTLTIDRRRKFNGLVESINRVIQETVEEFDKDTAIGYRATFSDWSSWPGIVDGQFCSPKSTGWYPDPSQPELVFIKFNTAASGKSPHDEVKRRDLASDSNNFTGSMGEAGGDLTDAAEQESDAEHQLDEREHAQLRKYQDQLRGRLTREHIYNSLLWKSPDPRAEALHKLDARAPAPPSCPGDGLPGIPLGLGLPDSFLSIFHPNKKGHEAMAAYALQNLVWLRADILKVDNGLCSQARDDFTCWQQKGSKAFVDYIRVVEAHKDFCDSVQPPANTINWKFEKTYHKGTPDEHSIELQLLDGASAFDKDKCLESLKGIIDRCDGNDPDNNPLNFKFGGRWVRGSYHYSISPRKARTMIKKKWGTCQGWWKVATVEYSIYGSGWATHDFGQNTLLKSMRDCGSWVTGWGFDYCPDGCDAHGGKTYEWHAHFYLPTYGGAACMKNNWVPEQHGAQWGGENTWNSGLGCPGAA